MRIVAGSVFVSIAVVMSAPLPVGARAQEGSGWILWEKNMINKPGMPESVTWEPLDGYELLTECRDSGRELLKAALVYMNGGGGKLLGSIRPDGRSATFAVTRDGAQGTIDIRYLCFPGGFDPRPPGAPSPSPKR